MDALKRFGRVLWSHVVLIALAAVVGTVVAVFFARQYNQDIRPSYVAVASITILAEGEGTTDRGRSAEQPLEEARIKAVEANEAAGERLGENSIVFSEDGQGLDFQALAGTSSKAVADAERLRSNFVEANPEVLESPLDVDGLVAEARVLDQTLQGLLPPEEPEPEQPSPAESVQADLIQGEISGLQAQASQLAVDKVAEDDESEIENIDEELAAIQERLVELETELRVLQPEGSVQGGGEATGSGGQEVDPLAELPFDQRWRITALEGRLESLEQQYTDSFISDDDDDPTTVLAAASFNETTKTEIPVLLAGAAGLLASLLLASAIATVVDRFRRPIWTPEQVPAPVLAELPISSRPLAARAAAARRNGIRLVRSALMPAGTDAGLIVGFVGVDSTFPEAVADLGYRVADNFTRAGSSVLVVDTRLQSETSRGGGLNALLSEVGEGEQAVAGRVSAMLDGLPEVVPGLTFLSGRSDADSADDITAGKPFAQLMAQARSRYDVTLVIGPDGAPSQIGDVAKHLDQQVIVLARGRSTLDEFERVSDLLERYPKAQVAAVLLVMDRRRTKGDTKGTARTRGRRGRRTQVQPATDGRDAIPADASVSNF